MTRPLVILHGWSDNADSFLPLRTWLGQNGFALTEIWLGDYLSMNDEVTLYDLGFAFRRALDRNGVAQEPHGGDPSKGFDLLVHSTGGLVAREYLRQACCHSDGRRDASLTPVRHIAMLAPANFGSPLARLGKSVIGRFFKGWDWDHTFQSGERILSGLDLAAPYSFQLALDDLFDPDFPIFSTDHTLATILVGTCAYPGIKSTFHENGSDGTVRVATANLSASYFAVDFSDPAGFPSPRWRDRTCKDVAIAIFHRNHGTITQPPNPSDPLPQQQEWSDLLLAALRVDAGGYLAHVQRCTAFTCQTLAEGRQGPQEKWYHEYQHVVFRVRDQHGQPVKDYVVEFYGGKGDDDPVMQVIHKEIIEVVNTNAEDTSHRSFFIDTTDLRTFLATGQEVNMRLSAAPISRRIRYRNPDHGFPVFSDANRLFIRPNEPILVDVTLHRDPDTDSADPGVNVFRIHQ
ncbi:MAG: hypothetical protein PHC88_04780 [Terrimicrobiaceae bacterium]|nr:hypothetical protein [Terrimicrobiaceae bacterium]